MKKIGVITLCSNNNFGNKLQNYAVIETLNKLGCNANTIWIENSFKSCAIKQELKRLKRLFFDYFIDYNRNKYFLIFNRLLNINYKIVFNNDIQKLFDIFDYFIVGSDQVWNYHYFDNDNIYLLKKSSVNKNIAFSASFGISSIPEKYHYRYKECLNNFKAISVREDKAKEIVEELTKRKDVITLIDPTMLLTPEEWDKISIRPKQLDGINEDKYILNYFLGELSESRKKEIERVAIENNCHVINILDKNDPFYECGPSEFLFLEKHAFLICTDSFHSSVFAILYNRPFIVYEREDKVEKMNSRIDTLLNKFKLENRRYNGKEITKDNLKHDYTEAYKILEKERKKSKDFLERALDIKDSD